MKKWLLSKLLLLVGLSTFGQVFQPGNALADYFLKDVPDPTADQVVHQLNASPPVLGEVNPELAAALQYTLDSLTAKYGVVGLSGALLLPNGDVWKGTSGINNVLGDTISTEMRLGMGSVTKTFTAAAIMQLVEENSLNLDDSLDQWLPAYPNVDSTITIRQLLNHTSGIFNYTDNPEFGIFLNQNLGDVFEPTFILENYVPAPSFSPGATWGYSNTNYLLLGLIIEAATGNTYQNEIRTRLLLPNGLSTMSLHPNETPTGEIAHLWLDLTGNGVPDDFTGAGLSLNGLFSMAWAAGAMITTPEDLTHWLKNLVTGQVVSQNSVDQMMETIPLTSTFGYGLGLINIKVGGHEWWGHEGSIGYLTVAYYSPDLDISMVLISNASPTDELGDIYFDLVQTYLDYQPNAAGERLLENNNLMVYPNPFRDEFLVAIDLEKPSAVDLIVTNQLGQTVFQKEYNQLSAGMNNLNLKGCEKWPAGVYQIQLQGEGWIVTDRVVKE